MGAQVTWDDVCEDMIVSGEGHLAGGQTTDREAIGAGRRAGSVADGGVGNG
jgi:hypothetical protein